MNTPSSYDDSLLYVHIDTWEYQCCGTVPRVGAELSGTLTVHRSDIPGYRASEVTGFDPRSGMVHLGSTVAQLGYGLSVPDGELILALGWHERDARPSVTGTIERVIEKTGRFLPIGEDRTLLVDPDSRQFRDVDEATRWPEEQLESGGAATIGVVVGLRVTDMRIPTDAEIEERLAEEERVERTLHLTGPSACFGSAVPREGDCITVDLGDARLEVQGRLGTLDTPDRRRWSAHLSAVTSAIASSPGGPGYDSRGGRPGLPWRRCYGSPNTRFGFMNSAWSLDMSLQYVHISNWEYQCCGTVPRVGGTVRGSLTLHPSRRPGYPAPEVLDWDPASGLVRVGDLYAQLGFSVTDPYRTDLIVSLGWHDAGPAPTVVGTVEILLEETGTYVRQSTGELDIAPASVEYREVREATMWPEDRLEAGGPAAAGVVAGVRLASPVEEADRARILAEGLRLFTEAGV